MRGIRWIALGLLLSLLPVLAGASTAGGAEDPLVTRSYVDGSFTAQLNTALTQEIRTDLTEPVTADLAGTASGSFRFTGYQAGESVTFKTGTIFMPTEGTAAALVRVGELVDVTEGKAYTGSLTLTANHRYMPAEDTIVLVTAGTALTLAADGANGQVNPFTDVKPTDWYYANVVQAVEEGLINGLGNGLYGPAQTFTVAQTVKVAACLHQLAQTGTVTLQNGTDQWYSTYADYALSHGILTYAVEDWNAAITRTQFVNILYNAMAAKGYAQINSIPGGAIPDVAVGDSCWEKIYAFYRAGILTGDETGNFNPDSSILRREVAAILNRMTDASMRKSVTLS